MLFRSAVTKQRIKIEFEFRSAAFLKHKREWLLLRKLDPSARWMVVCWKDDLKEKADGLPGLKIVALEKFSSRCQV